MRIRDHKPRTAGSRLTSPPHLTERKTEAQAEKFLVHRLQRGGTQSPLTNTRLLSPGEILNSSPPGGCHTVLLCNAPPQQISGHHDLSTALCEYPAELCGRTPCNVVHSRYWGKA